MGELAIKTALGVSALPLNAGDILAARSYDRSPGGAGFDQALACARLAKCSLYNDRIRHFATVSITGDVGDDYHGRAILQALDVHQINSARVAQLEGCQTSKIFAVWDQVDEEATMVVLDPHMGYRTATTIVGDDPGWVPDVIILQAQNLSDEYLQETINMANTGKIPVVLSPSPSNEIPQSVLAGVDHLIATERECQVLLRRPSLDHIPAEAWVQEAGFDLRRRGVKNVVINMRSRGVFFYTEDGDSGTINFEYGCRGEMNWVKYNLVFRAAYAMAVARNREIFRTEAAIGEAFEVALLAMKRHCIGLPELSQLPFSLLRFDHARELEVRRMLEGDRPVADWLAHR
ncbi:hypothetical protein IMZ48_44250 [Candidatus Bathyarchaeota archaeon]|nr:hypothetical protein [Candidatus Bathyarchaeota archaeon]